MNTLAFKFCRVCDEKLSMKIFIVLFIMASLSFKLNAFDLDPNDKKNLEDLINKTKNDKTMMDPKTNPYYRMLREEEIRNDRTCSHCPKYLLLTEEVNKIVDKMANDPKQSSEELPVKLTKLKFMFYDQAVRDQDNNVQCKRFLDMTPDFKPTKFDGQFKLLAEDVLKFQAVTDIYYKNPNQEETVYYYRGEGSEKNLIVQAVITKDGGKLRYFRYIPSQQEENPYNLPDLDKTTPLKYEPGPADNYVLKNENAAPETSGGISSGVTGGIKDILKDKEIGNDNVKLKFKADVERRNKYIPNNVHFMEAKVDQEIVGDIKLQGKSDVSLAGNVAHLSLKREGKDMVLVDLDTKLNGDTTHKVTVPFDVRVYDDLPGIKGNVQTSNTGQVLNLTLVDKGIDLVRSEFRRNADTGATSYVLAKDVSIAKNEVVSMQYGKGENNVQYASIKHAKTIKENITLVLDVRYDQEKRASLYYQVSAKF